MIKRILGLLFGWPQPGGLMSVECDFYPISDFNEGWDDVKDLIKLAFGHLPETGYDEDYFDNVEEEEIID